MSALLTPLFADIDAYLHQWVDPVVTARRTSPARAARLVATGAGKRRIDDMRAQFAAIRSGLRSDAQSSRDDAHASVRRAVIAAVAGMLISAVLYLLYGFYVGRSILVPVREVAATARRMAAGDRAARVEGADTARGELGAMARSYNVMADTLEENHDELEAQREELSDYAEELEAQRGELERTIAAARRREDARRDDERLRRGGRGGGRVRAARHLILNGVADAVRCEVGALFVRDARRGGDLALATARGLRPSKTCPRSPARRRARRPRGRRAAHRSRRLPGRACACRRLRPARHLARAPRPAPAARPGLRRAQPRPARRRAVSQADIVLVSHLADQSGVALSKAVVLRESRRGAASRAPCWTRPQRRSRSSTTAATRSSPTSRCARSCRCCAEAGA